MKRESLNEAAMYAGITKRDRSLDGHFIYAVLTTGIYCRPSCSARTPLRENVRFFSSSEEADVAGFRACKRCKPDDPHYGTAHLIELARYILAHAGEKLPLKTLAARQGVSPGYLQRSFKAVFGISPKAFQDAARLNSLKSLLKTGDDITGAIFEAGYGAPSRFYESAARQIGMSPKAYRDGGKGEIIIYACRDTDLGRLMMAATEKGVCFVMFGAEEDQLLSQLQAEFPKACLSQAADNGGEPLDAWMTALDNHLSQGAPRPDIPSTFVVLRFKSRCGSFF